jgi:hypothetical protein
LRPKIPPFSAMNFQYRSLDFSRLSSGIGAAPVSGAWMPITISFSETPSRSWGPAGSEAEPVDAGVPAFGAPAVTGRGPAEDEASGPEPPGWAVTAPDADDDRARAAGAGPDRSEEDGPATVVAVVAVAAADGRTGGAPVVAVAGETAEGGGAATPSGPPTPAFWPQAAETSTAAAAPSARSRKPAEAMSDQGTDR